MNPNLQLGIGTGGGTLVSVLGALALGDVFATAILAALGAVVSFTVTLLLQRLCRHRKK